MNFVGEYYAGRGTLKISAEGKDGALIEVWWGGSAAEHSTWTMHGKFDPKTMTRDTFPFLMFENYVKTLQNFYKSCRI